MKKLCAVFLLGAFALPANIFAIDLKQSKFTQVVNNVEVISATDKSLHHAAVNDMFNMPDILRTGPGSRAELVAADDTITRVGANTIFSFDPANRTIDLQQGSILFHSPHGKGGGTIRTGSATASVLGTTIIVTCTPNGGFKLLDLEGQAEIKFLNGLSQTLEPGQMTFILPSGGTSPVIIFRLDSETKGSSLVSGFVNPLPSQGLINAEVTQQLLQVLNNNLEGTTYLVGNNATPDTVQVVNDINNSQPNPFASDAQIIGSDKVPTDPDTVNYPPLDNNQTQLTSFAPPVGVASFSDGLPFMGVDGDPAAGFVGNNVDIDTAQIDLTQFTGKSDFEIMAQDDMRIWQSLDFITTAPSGPAPTADALPPLPGTVGLLAGGEMMIAPGSTLEADTGIFGLAAGSFGVLDTTTGLPDTGYPNELLDVSIYNDVGDVDILSESDLSIVGMNSDYTVYAGGSVGIVSEKGSLFLGNNYSDSLLDDGHNVAILAGGSVTLSALGGDFAANDTEVYAEGGGVDIIALNQAQIVNGSYIYAGDGDINLTAGGDIYIDDSTLEASATISEDGVVSPGGNIYIAGAYVGIYYSDIYSDYSTVNIISSGDMYLEYNNIESGYDSYGGNVTISAGGSLTDYGDGDYYGIYAYGGNLDITAGGTAYFDYDYLYADGSVNIESGGTLTITDYADIEAYDGNVSLTSDNADVDIYDSSIYSDNGDVNVSAFGHFDFYNDNGFELDYWNVQSGDYAEFESGGGDVDIYDSTINSIDSDVDIYADYGSVDVEDTTVSAGGNVDIEAGYDDDGSEALSLYYDDISAGNDVTLDAPGNITISGDYEYGISATGGTVNIESYYGNVNIDQTSISAGDNVNISADDAYLNIGPDDNVSIYAGANISLWGETGATVEYTSAEAYDELDLDTWNGQLYTYESSLTADTGDVNLKGYYSSVYLDYATQISAGGNVDIQAGYYDDGGESVSLYYADISAGNDVTIQAPGDISIYSYYNYGISAGGTVDVESYYGSVDLDYAAISAGGDVDVYADNNYADLENTSISAGGGVNIESYDTLYLGYDYYNYGEYGDGNNQISAYDSVTLTSDYGDINVDDYSLATTTGDIGIYANYGNVDAEYSQINAGGNVNIQAGYDDDSSETVTLNYDDITAGNSITVQAPGTVNIYGEYANGISATGGTVDIESYYGNVNIDQTSISAGDNVNISADDGYLTIGPGDNVSISAGWDISLWGETGATVDYTSAEAYDELSLGSWDGEIYTYQTSLVADTGDVNITSYYGSVYLDYGTTINAGYDVNISAGNYDYSDYYGESATLYYDSITAGDGVFVTAPGYIGAYGAGITTTGSDVDLTSYYSSVDLENTSISAGGGVNIESYDTLYLGYDYYNYGEYGDGNNQISAYDSVTLTSDYGDINVDDYSLATTTGDIGIYANYGNVDAEYSQINAGGNVNIQAGYDDDSSETVTLNYDDITAGNNITVQAPGTVNIYGEYANGISATGGTVDIESYYGNVNIDSTTVNAGIDVDMTADYGYLNVGPQDDVAINAGGDINLNGYYGVNVEYTTADAGGNVSVGSSYGNIYVNQATLFAETGNVNLTANDGGVDVDGASSIQANDTVTVNAYGYVDIYDYSAIYAYNDDVNITSDYGSVDLDYGTTVSAGYDVNISAGNEDAYGYDDLESVTLYYNTITAGDGVFVTAPGYIGAYGTGITTTGSDVDLTSYYSSVDLENTSISAGGNVNVESYDTLYLGYYYYNYGYYGDGNNQISANDSVTLTSDDGDINVDDYSLGATTGDVGIYADYGNVDVEDSAISAGNNVDIQAGYNDYYGYDDMESVTLNYDDISAGNNVTVQAPGDISIYSYYDYGISAGGTVDVESYYGTVDVEYAVINADGDVDIQTDGGYEDLNVNYTTIGAGGAVNIISYGGYTTVNNDTITATGDVSITADDYDWENGTLTMDNDTITSTGGNANFYTPGSAVISGTDIDAEGGTATITTYYGDVTIENSSTVGASQDVDVYAYYGNVDVESSTINAGGNVDLEAGYYGYINNADTLTLNSDTITAGDSVALNAYGDVYINDTTSITATSGDVDVNSYYGTIDMEGSEIDPGGDASMESSGTLTLGADTSDTIDAGGAVSLTSDSSDVDVYGSSIYSGDSANGGSTTITANNGNILLEGDYITAYGGGLDNGNITISAGGNITFNSDENYNILADGNVSITSAGTVGAGLGSPAELASGGDIEFQHTGIIAGSTELVDEGSLNSGASLTGGSVSISAENGNVYMNDNGIVAYAGNAEGSGDVSIYAYYTVDLENTYISADSDVSIESGDTLTLGESSGNEIVAGGGISLTSDYGDVDVYNDYYLDAGGDVDIYANYGNVDVENVQINSGNNVDIEAGYDDDGSETVTLNYDDISAANDIAVAAPGDINILGVYQYGISAGWDVNIESYYGNVNIDQMTITAGDDVNISADDGHLTIGPSDNVSISAQWDISLWGETGATVDYTTAEAYDELDLGAYNGEVYTYETSLTADTGDVNITSDYGDVYLDTGTTISAGYDVNINAGFEDYCPSADESVTLNGDTITAGDGVYVYAPGSVYSYGSSITANGSDVDLTSYNSTVDLEDTSISAFGDVNVESSDTLYLGYYDGAYDNNQISAGGSVSLTSDYSDVNVDDYSVTAGAEVGITSPTQVNINSSTILGGGNVSVTSGQGVSIDGGSISSTTGIVDITAGNNSYEDDIVSAAHAPESIGGSAPSFVQPGALYGPVDYIDEESAYINDPDTVDLEANIDATVNSSELISDGGDVIVNSGGTEEINDSYIEADNGSVSLTASGDVYLYNNELYADDGDVTVESSEGNVTVDSYNDIYAYHGSVDIYADYGNVAVNSSYIYADNNVDIEAGYDDYYGSETLALDNATINAGESVYLDAWGDLTVSDDSTITSVIGDVEIDSYNGNVGITSSTIYAGYNDNLDVSGTTISSGSDADVTAYGPYVSIHAGGTVDIESSYIYFGGNVDIEGAQITAGAGEGNSGTVNITSDGSLYVGGYSDTLNGDTVSGNDITISGGSTITSNGGDVNINNDANASSYDYDGILIENSSVDYGNINITGSTITANGGSVDISTVGSDLADYVSISDSTVSVSDISIYNSTITAGNDVTISAGGYLTIGAEDDVTITAGGDICLWGTFGATVDYSTATAGGKLDLGADGNISTYEASLASGTGYDVNVISDYGNVDMENSTINGGYDVNIEAGNDDDGSETVTLVDDSITAADAVNVNAPGDVNISDLTDISATDSGVNVESYYGYVNIYDTTITASGDVDITSDNESVTLNSGDAELGDDVQSINGSVNVYANYGDVDIENSTLDAGSDVNIGAGFDDSYSCASETVTLDYDTITAGDAVYVNAPGDVNINDSTSITATGSEVDIESYNGNVNIDSTTINAGGQVDISSDTGYLTIGPGDDVSITAGGDINLQGVEGGDVECTTATSGGAIELTVWNGEAYLDYDNFSTTSSGAIDITARESVDVYNSTIDAGGNLNITGDSGGGYGNGSVHTPHSLLVSGASSELSTETPAYVAPLETFISDPVDVEDQYIEDPGSVILAAFTGDAYVYESTLESDGGDVDVFSTTGNTTIDNSSIYADNGAVNISAALALNLYSDGVYAENGSLGISSAGDTSIQFTGLYSYYDAINIQVGGDLTMENENYLSADDTVDITVTGNAAIENNYGIYSTYGDVDITAGGALTMYYTTAEADDGNVNLTGTGSADIEYDDLYADSGNVNVSTGSGGLTMDYNDVEAYDSVVLNSGGDIYLFDNYDLIADYGDVDIYASDALTMIYNYDVEADNGSLDLDAAGAVYLYDNDLYADSGDVGIYSDDSTVDIEDTYISASGNVTIESYDTLYLGWNSSGEEIDAGGAVSLTSAYGDVDVADYDIYSYAGSVDITSVNGSVDFESSEIYADNDSSIDIENSGLTADQDVNINTSGGSVSFSAYGCDGIYGSTIDLGGNITIASGSSITAAGGVNITTTGSFSVSGFYDTVSSSTISGSDISISGSTIAANGGDVDITDNGYFSLGAFYGAEIDSSTVSLNEIDINNSTIAANDGDVVIANNGSYLPGWVSINSSTVGVNDINIGNSTITASGDVDITSGGTLTLEGVAPTTLVLSTGDTIEAGGSVNLTSDDADVDAYSASITADNNDVNIYADYGNVDVENSQISAGGNVDIQAGYEDDGSETVTLDYDDVTAASDVTIQAPGNINIYGDYDLGITATAGTVDIDSYYGNVNVDDTTITAGADVDMSADDGTLNVGPQDDVSISAGGDINLDGYSGVNLDYTTAGATGNVYSTSQGEIYTYYTSLTADNGVVNLTAYYGDVDLEHSQISAGSSVDIQAGYDDTVDSYGETVTLNYDDISATGGITIQAPGNVNISDVYDTGISAGGTVNIESYYGSVDLESAAVSAAGNVSVTSDSANVTVNNSTVASTGGSVSIGNAVNATTGYTTIEGSSTVQAVTYLSVNSPDGILLNGTSGSFSGSTLNLNSGNGAQSDTIQVLNANLSAFTAINIAGNTLDIEYSNLGSGVVNLGSLSGIANVDNGVIAYEANLIRDQWNGSYITQGQIGSGIGTTPGVYSHSTAP
jgi:uncharacterized protein (DUF2345 family)